MYLRFFYFITGIYHLVVENEDLIGTICFQNKKDTKSVRLDVNFLILTM